MLGLEGCHHVWHLGLLKVLMAESRVRCVEEGKLDPLVCHPGVHVPSQGQPVVSSSLSVTLSLNTPCQDIENNFRCVLSTSTNQGPVTFLRLPSLFSACWKFYHRTLTPHSYLNSTKNFSIHLFSANGCFAYMYVCLVCAACAVKLEEGISSPGTKASIFNGNTSILCFP